ncbi:MAG: hypothetical protein SGJ15_08965 [Bacteroidota bacterium]|nr:hypothetical protein [Bacteroidota bacterium]
MRIIKVIAVIVFMSYHVTAQLLFPDHNTVFKKEYTFSPQYISKNQIKKIVFEILDKKDFEAPVDRRLVENYEFSSFGFLLRFYYTDIIKTIEKEVNVPAQYRGRRKIKSAYSYMANDFIYDTISTTFMYKELSNKLLMKRGHLGSGFYDTRYYRYDSIMNMIEETRYKETNVSQSRNDFILGSQVLVSKDSTTVLKYTEEQTKIIYFNSERRPYKEQIILKKNEHVININESYVAASWIQQNQQFEYNVTGQMTQAVFNSNANVNLSYKHTFDYDKNGWLLTEKRYKNDILLTESSFVNDTTSSLVNSIVIRDFANKSIRIIKMKYSYYDSLQVKGK